MNGYKLFGRPIQPHILVISTLLGCIGGVSILKIRSKSNKKIGSNEISSGTANDKDYMDIEQLIDNFLKEHDDKEDKK